MTSILKRKQIHENLRISRRDMLLSLPAIALAPRLFGAQAAAPPIRVAKLNHFELRVADVKRSVDFYQSLFGMPIQARPGSSVCLRIGAGPHFLKISPTDAGENPNIHHLGITTENFNAERMMQVLMDRGMAKVDAPAKASEFPGLMKTWIQKRDATSELYFTDADGLIVQLQDKTYCGGGGALGNMCAAPEASPKKGVLALEDMSHLTVFTGDAARSNKFYQDLFGLSIQAYQGPPGTAPLLGVGDKIQFVMFGGGGGGRGGAAAAPTRSARIDHICMNMKNFNADAVIKTLTDFGVAPRGAGGRGANPLVNYISMRTEARGGAKEGTPELYFTDPDGLLIQLQDVSYCGGGGVLGNVCTQ